MKRITAFIMVFFLLTISFSFGSTNYEKEANSLKQIGVFQGTGQGFELDRAPTRLEGAAMFVRLLGAESMAKANNTSHPFKDVPKWGSPYVGYLYANGLTKGISTTSFGSDNIMDGKSYLTFILRALGYSDADGDFTWSSAIGKSKDIGLIDNDFLVKLNTNKFLRDHVARVSYLALKQNMKGKESSLAKKLIAEGAFTEADGIAMGVIGGNIKTDIVFSQKHPYVEQYKVWDISTEVFSPETLAALGASGFVGTDGEIAKQIYDWQVSHMVYAGPTANYKDAGFGSRWNFMIPGIYPASKRIEHKNAQGKIYGICGDFAYIYKAIANAYNLESRITTFPLSRHFELFGSLPKEVEDETTFRGLGREEYDLLNVVLKKNNINLTYDQIHRAIQGRSTLSGHVQGMHTRAEVKINGKWVAYDASRELNAIATSAEYANDNNYVPQNWDGIYNPIRLYAPPFFDSAVDRSPVDFDGLALYFTFGPQVLYTGITDDFGNKNRARDFDGFVNGDALLPYVSQPKGLADFLQVPEGIVAEEEYGEFMAGYYLSTGRQFNIIADFLINTDDRVSAETYVRQYNGITGEKMTVAEFNSYMNMTK